MSRRFRLSIMMFLQYAVPGVWGVTLPTFLRASFADGGLSLSGATVGWLYATHAVAASLTPLLAGLIADRFFATERVIGLLHLCGAVVLWQMYIQCQAMSAAGAADFPTLLVLFLLNALCYIPTITLTNALAFRNLDQPGRQFGPVRVWGTIGWAVAGFVVGMTLSPKTPVPLAVAAVLSALMALYSFSLPHTPPSHQARSVGELLGLPALRILAEPHFRVFVIAALAVTMLTSFHNLFLNPYLNDLGLERAVAWQTVGQVTEVICILSIPLVRDRLGLKGMLLLGLTSSAVRFAFYAAGSLPWLISVGIPMHGLCYSFFFIAAALFVDRDAPRDLRASAQGLVTLLTLGVGAFVGNWFAGWAVDQCQTAEGVRWWWVWLTPAVGSVLVAGYFARCFHEPQVPLVESGGSRLI